MRAGLMIALALFGTLAARAEAPDLGDIRQMVEERQYAAALRRISAGLALKGAAAKAVGRYDLYMLKGECHLQLRVLPLANEAYANAVKEAKGDAERAVAAAHVALLKASRGFAFTPKASPEKGRAEAIDVLDRESRKRAFLAMLGDELAANEGRLKAARGAKGLAAITEVVGPLAVMEGYELAGTGEAAKVGAIRVELLGQAKKVMADALRTMAKRVGEVDKEANTFVETWQDTLATTPLGQTTVKKERVYKKRGLSEADTIVLQETAGTCDKLGLGLGEFAKGLGVEEKVFEPFEEEAGRLRKEVGRVLEVDYQRVYRELPKK